MRVLITWPAGIAPSSLKRLSALNGEGFDVGLLCASSWPEGGAKIQVPDAEHPFPVFSKGAAFEGKGAYYFYPTGIGDVVKEFQPDLIHVREEMYTVFSAQFQLERRVRFPGVPFVFESWQNIRKDYPWPARWFEATGYKAARAAIAGVPSVEAVLRSGGFDGPIEMIPLGGVDLNGLTPEGADERELFPLGRPIVGFAGRLVPAKGVADLIEAVAKVEPQPVLAIVGDGPSRVELQGQALGRGIDSRFLGAVAPERLVNLMRSFDVLVLPSRTTPRWKEQWGRVLTEAMACGVPVIGSDSGEIPYVIGDAGLTFPEGSVSRLTECLRRVLKDPEEAARLRTAGLARVRSFSWEQHAKKTAEFYRRLMA